jgi:hypothetical protein
MSEVIIISVILAVLAAVGVCVGVIIKYKRGLDSPIYPIDRYTKLDLTHREDRFLNRHVTRVKISSDSNKKR